MKSTHRSIHSHSGFTIVEMIAVIAVIAILIGLMLPALSMVQDMAANVSQKAQFTNISMGLEGFREDIGDYPDSSDSFDYQGAQKLAEAMIGMDGFGYHPDSRFRADGTDANGEPLYKPDIDILTDEEVEANIASRKGPYLELDTANAVKLSSIYSSTGNLNGDTFILADKFKTAKNFVTGKKTGMPILYFKADTFNTLLSALAADNDRSVYDYKHNQDFIFNLPSPIDNTAHEMTKDIFYEEIANPNFTDPVRPHNNESFILLSAGLDGLYGTVDDVYNFDNEQ